MMSSQNFHKTPTLVGFAEEEERDLPPPLPKQIGGYKIESLLNRGGTSLLYLGIHPETHEPLTVKVLSAKYVSKPEMVERFMREAEIIELTNHPNIVQIFGHGKWEGGVYIAMEFVQGLSLRQMILQQALSLKRALEITLQISHALTHLHAHGIIHRDLKPENILLTSQGGIKVIDFGISQIYSEKRTPEHSQLLGTPAYMSPEQQRDPQNVSFATDMYSLGVIAYELILGRLSYGVVHLALMPKGMQRILAKALQPDPKARYEDIVDFIQDLSSYLTSDELKKDRRSWDYLSELSENLKEAQTQFVPTHLPDWSPRIEMGLVSNCNTAISSVYYDFFQLRDGHYHILMGESLETGVEGLLQIAMLRGMVHALAPTISNSKTFVETLNERLLTLSQKTTFSFSCLSLSPHENTFSYISCGYSPLWYLPEGAAHPRRLSADNLALGIDQGEMMEVDSNWKVGDTLVLHTFQAELAKNIDEIEVDEQQFLAALTENLLTAPQKQAEAIFRKISHTKERALFEKPITVISLGRNQ